MGPDEPRSLTDPAELGAGVGVVIAWAVAGAYGGSLHLVGVTDDVSLEIELPGDGREIV